MLQEKNEYQVVLDKLYSKSLVLESVSDFNPVFYFYFMDTIAHVDFSICILAYNYHNVRNKMNMEYLRWRIDEEKVGDKAYFPEFINWLKENHREKFDSLPSLWRNIYDVSAPASYRSFRISQHPDDTQPNSVSSFNKWIDELFDLKFIRSLYKESSLDAIFQEFLKTKN
ncbi:hypothetical protein F1737_05730 [Methanoplanus sp. FWC-SCC4]|uniref:Uncharacterized protein n=1 Tax=Methanochimaera problematica TaxID=2609417 RepID=A0AA97I483_9EURY|nr:hypothetical protein [Methanoplanus sp. FWC-SCC4]WOF16244.1 hypothetical protein F1737_05730 [Methanoplanus sp. FWC-SCC4]